MEKKFKYVEAIHELDSQNTYIWAADASLDVKVGDYVIVKCVPYGQTEEISTIVKVVEIDPEVYPSAGCHKEVIAVASKITAEIFFQEKKYRKSKASKELALVSPTREVPYTARDAFLKGKVRAGLWCEELTLVRHECTMYGDFDFIVEVRNMGPSSSCWTNSINFVIPSLIVKGHVTGNGDVLLGSFGSNDMEISATALSEQYGIEVNTPCLAEDGIIFFINGLEEESYAVSLEDLTEGDVELLLELVKELVYRELINTAFEQIDVGEPLYVRHRREEEDEE